MHLTKLNEKKNIGIVVCHVVPWFLYVAVAVGPNSASISQGIPIRLLGLARLFMFPTSSAKEEQELGLKIETPEGIFC